MKRTLLSALLFVTCIGVAGAAMAADGAAIYKAKCVACHGPEGKGSPMAPGFKGNKYITSSSDADITDVILKGRAGAAKKYKNMAMAMPPQKLSDAEVSAVVAYLKSLASK